MIDKIKARLGWGHYQIILHNGKPKRVPLKDPPWLTEMFKKNRETAIDNAVQRCVEGNELLSV